MFKLKLMTICLFSFLAVLPAHALIAPDVQECVIDELMLKNYEEEELKTEGSVKVAMGHVDIKETSCFSSLMDIGSDISGTFSSFKFSFKDLANAFTKALCRQAANAIGDLVQSAQVTYDAPYGVASGSVGLTKGGNWSRPPRINPSGTNVFSPAERIASELGSAVGQRARDELRGGRDTMSGVNRKLKEDGRRHDEEFWRDVRRETVEGVR